MTMFMNRTCGHLESKIDQLHDLLPFEGACKNPRSSNKALDKFRRAQNVIYDLFNNGLYNRRNQWVQTMNIALPICGIRSQQYIRPNWESIEDFVAPRFIEIINDAVKEQGLGV